MLRAANFFTYFFFSDNFIGMKFFRALAVLFFCLLCVSCGVSKERATQAQAHYKLGVSYLSENNLQPAFVEFQKAIELNPDNKEYHNVLGLVYLRLMDYTHAEEHFRRSVRIDEDYSEAHNNLCYLYYIQRQYPRAEEACKKALSNPLYLTPEKAFNNLAKTCYRQRRYDEAIKYYWEAIRRAPALYIAFYGLSLAHNAKREYAEAEKSLTKAIELDPKYRGDKKRAEADMRAGRFDAEEPQDLKDFLDILHY